MSTFSIIGLTPNHATESLIEFQNSHGFHSSIWRSIGTRYLGPTFSLNFEAGSLWPLWKRQDIPEHHRFALISTFDQVYIERKDFKRAAADFRKFLADFPKEENIVNHIAGISEFLNNEPNIPAIGFQTSLCDDLLQAYDEETDEYKATPWDELTNVYELVDLVSKPAP